MKLFSTVISSLTLLFLLPAIAFAQPRTQGEPEMLIKDANRVFQNPEWSPDGNKIAFTSAKNKGIWIADAQGDNLRQITDESAGYKFKWSPDSQSLLARVSEYVDRRRNHAIKIYHTSGEAAEQITEYRAEMPALPTWAAFGEKIVLITEKSVETFDSGLEIQARFKQNPTQAFYVLKPNAIAKGMIPENSTQDISPFENATYLNLSVSPDGQKLAFEVYGGNLYVMNVDGSNLIDLGPANRPSWSPDSEYVVATISEDDGHNYQSSDIYAFKVDGSEQINLTEQTDLIAMNPSWSPQGDKIAFDAIDKGAIYMIRISR